VFDAHANVRRLVAEQLSTEHTAHSRPMPNGGEVDAAAGFDGLHPERQAQVAFARAGRSDEWPPARSSRRVRAVAQSRQGFRWHMAS
jgi:hypothetical protein